LPKDGILSTAGLRDSDSGREGSHLDPSQKELSKLFKTISMAAHKRTKKKKDIRINSFPLIIMFFETGVWWDVNLQDS